MTTEYIKSELDKLHNVGPGELKIKLRWSISDDCAPIDTKWIALTPEDVDLLISWLKERI